MKTTKDSIPQSGQASPEWMRLLLRYLEQMDYGQITLMVHQGEVVEVQKTERTRFAHRKS
jgi:hypothetical protein